MLIKDAKVIIGSKTGIGFTTKTGFSFGLPAKSSCKVGCKLSKIKGSTCYGCYASSGNYLYKKVKQGLLNRLEKVKKLEDKDFRKKWIEAMTLLITSTANRNDKDMWFFRWHDSGDIIGVNHLKAIVEVAKATPQIKHWLPTKEENTVKEFLKTQKLPKNLTIRLSGYFVDKDPDFSLNLPKAKVYKNSKPKGYICPAILQHKGCREVGCRACWDKKVKIVNYRIHR